MKIHTSLTTAVALLAIPAAALAFGNGAAGQATATHAPTLKSPVPKFKKADKNHDGKIEWKEAKALHVPKKLFKHDDFNENGTLNKTEWLFVRMDMTNKKHSSAG